MTLNTIHQDGGHRKQHLHGDYFGPHGVLAISRICLASALGGEYQSPIDHARAIEQAHVRLMSTIFSALGHCVAKARTGLKKSRLWHLLQGTKLLFELEELVSTAVDFDEKDLEPGERDVLIAGLHATSYVSWMKMNFWYRKAAEELIRFQVNTLPRKHVSSLFARARAYKMKSHFREDELKVFRQEVLSAIQDHTPDSKDVWLSWMDVARLAKLIGRRDIMKEAALRDGHDEVKLKAGV